MAINKKINSQIFPLKQTLKDKQDDIYISDLVMTKMECSELILLQIKKDLLP